MAGYHIEGDESRTLLRSCAITLALFLVSASHAQNLPCPGPGCPERELKATVVSKEEKQIKVKTKDDEKTIVVGSKTKGLENAKEGSKVTIKYTEKDGQLRASEINPR